VKTHQPQPLPHRSHLEDIGALDHDVLHRFVAGTGLHAAKPVDNIQALHDLTKHSVLAVEVWGWAQSDEELASVRARAGVGHAERAFAVVFERRHELVLELGAVDGSTTGSSTGRITTLDHEARDDAVEDDVVVFAGGCQSGKVLAGLDMLM